MPLGLEVHLPCNARHVLSRIVRLEQAVVELSTDHMGTDDCSVLWHSNTYRLVSLVHSETLIWCRRPWIRYYDYLFYYASDGHGQHTLDQAHSLVHILAKPRVVHWMERLLQAFDSLNNHVVYRVVGI